MFSSRLKKYKSFTLSELLVALAVIGLIASFTIPKVIQTVDAAANKAKFKEAYGAVSTALYEGMNSGEIKFSLGVSSNNGTYLLSKLVGNRLCSANSGTQGCAPSSQIGGNEWERNDSGIVLHSGTMMYGFNNWPDGSNEFAMDANGEQGPNTVGQDIMILTLCHNPQGCNNVWFEHIPTPGGKITYRWIDFTSTAFQDANKALFLSLFN